MSHLMIGDLLASCKSIDNIFSDPIDERQQYISMNFNSMSRRVARACCYYIDTTNGVVKHYFFEKFHSASLLPELLIRECLTTLGKTRATSSRI